MSIDPTPQPTNAKPTRGRPRRWALLVLVLAALAVRGRVMLSNQHLLHADTDGYREISWNLYHDGHFALSTDFFYHPAQPTAYRPPLYPVLITAFFLLPERNSAIGLFHVLLGVGTVIGVYRLGELWQLPVAGSLIATGLVIVDPLLVHLSRQVMNETLSAFLAMWTLVALALFVREPVVWRGLLAGALAGLCVLCRPTFLAWLVCVTVALPFVVPVARRHSAILSAVFLLGAAVAISPWPIRNWREFGRPIVTTTHGGYTLWLANNSSLYEWLRTGEWGSVWDASPFHSDWRRRMRGAEMSYWSTDQLRMRELPNDRLAYQLAFDTIAADPATFAYSCVVRVGLLWSVLPHQLTADESTSRRGLRYAVAIFYTAELALAALGLWILRRKLLSSPWLWSLLLLVSFTAVHTFYWTHMRMRAPLMGVVALLAAQAVVTLASRRRVANRWPSVA
jgi:hypothetical protein